MSGSIGVHLAARILRLDPGRRVATISVPSVGRGRSFRADYAAPGESLAGVEERCHGTPSRRSAGGVAAVRPTESGVEVDLRIIDGETWQRLAGGDIRVDVHCTFAGSVGADPYGGRVTLVDLG